MRKSPKVRTTRFGILTTSTLATMALTSTIAISGCGKQGYVVTNQQSAQKAPGGFTIPPKIDILLAEDDTGSIKSIYQTISQQMPQFLSGLEARGWDYHFAVTPLTTKRPIRQVVGSRYDVSWGPSAWIPSYPGQAFNANDPDQISSPYATAPSRFTEFLNFADTSNGAGGAEPGFATIQDALANRLSGTGFLRNDALLVLLVTGNGDDTSGVNMCDRGDGYKIPCDDGSYQNSLASYQSQFQSLKSDPGQVKFYAAVSNTQGNCLGSNALIGTRYKSMATALGGKSFDICNEPVSAVLDDLASNLQVQRGTYKTHYLFMASQPNVSTIQVTKYVGGDVNQAVVIPQDDVNGWTYVGMYSGYAIDDPIKTNYTTGYAIRLNGSAELIGDDTADVKFKPYGVTDSGK